MNPSNATRRRRHRLAGAVLAAIALTSVAACGTTVRDAHAALSDRANEGFDGSVGGVPGVTVPGATPPATSDVPTGIPVPTISTGSSVPTTSRGGTSTPPIGGATATASTGAASRTPKATNRPVFTGPAKLSAVEVGVIYSADLGAFAKLFGATADTGNLQTYANDTISYINSHGGLAGHVVRPVFYNIPLTSTQPYSTTMAAICSSWTQDHHVVAGIAVGFSIPNDLAACLSAHHVPYLSGGNYLHDSQTYRQIPYLVSPYEAGTDEVMPALIKHLFAIHWLTSKSRVGVLLGTNETAATYAYNDQIVPMLKGKVASVTSYGIDYPPSTQAAVAESETTSNDQLHARANGVTNMLFLAPGAEGSFIDDAYQQHWYPKYAVTSFDTPWGLASAHTKETLAALTGAVGIGWQPTMDVGTYGSNAFTNPTRKTCAKILKPTGLITNNIREYAGFQYCDGLLSVQAAANASGAVSITGQTMLAGYNNLGTTHTDAFTFLERIDSQQHDGASAYRPLAFVPSCRCFQYTGSITDF